MLICLDNSIEKELKRNPIPNGSSEDMSDDTNSREEGAEEVEYQSMATNTKVSSVNEQILSILRMIRKRITAEMKMKGRDDVKLLGQLLNILSYEERVFIMKKELARIEQVEEFKLFLDEGIDHLVQKGSHAGSVELPIATVEKMKDIRQDLVTLLNQLKTGYQENDTSYSSFKDDIS